MQNTCTSNENPNKLIENFLIAGMEQDQIKQEFILNSNMVTPKVLFSMYGKAETYQKYVQFIFPHKTSISRDPEPPSFHTFECTDEQGNQSFFHCIKFQEELDEYQVDKDFDYEGPLLKFKIKKIKEHLLREKMKKQMADYDKQSQNMLDSSFCSNLQKRLSRLNDVDTKHSSNKLQFALKVEQHVPILQEKELQNQLNFFEHCLDKRDTMEFICSNYDTQPKNSETMFHKDNAIIQSKPSQIKASISSKLLVPLNMQAPKSNGLNQKSATQTKKHEVRKASIIEIMENDFLGGRHDDVRSGKSNMTHMTNNILENTANKRVFEIFNDSMIVMSPIKSPKKARESQFKKPIEFKDEPKSQRAWEDQINKWQQAQVERMSRDLSSEKSPDVPKIRPKTEEKSQKSFTYNRSQRDLFPCKKDLQAEINRQQDEMKMGAKQESSESWPSTNKTQDWEDEQRQRREIGQQLRTHYYTTIAFVIQSKVEFHDAFKLILTKIYENLKDPAHQQKLCKVVKMSNDTPEPSQCMAFAETIAHIAFLRTIPAPVFNSQLNISFMDMKLNLKENHFTEIPHKNIHSVKVLIDCLDFQSIITCLKALIFDKTLIVFCYETSLLFNVIEGLKQLMFPFTFDYQQFLPANNVYKNADGQSLKDVFDELQGMQAVIFALETKKNMEREEDGEIRVIEIDDYMDWPDSVLLDIDASCVLQSNLIENRLPSFPKEIEMLKSLNRIKNRKLDDYDKIYPTNFIPNNYDQDNFNVESIREIFFGMLSPFLTSAYLAIDTSVVAPKNVHEFFNQDRYFAIIQQSCKDSKDKSKLQRCMGFAECLVQSRSFSHFMDGYIHDDIMNFDLANSILCHRGLLNRRYKSPQVTLQPYKDKVIQQLTHLSPKELDNLRTQLEQKQPSSFTNQQVSFYFRMPSLKQRSMLFQKIHLLLDKHLDKQSRTLQSNSQPLTFSPRSMMTPKYRQIIKLILDGYKQQSKFRVNIKVEQMDSIYKQKQALQSADTFNKEPRKFEINVMRTQPNQEESPKQENKKSEADDHMLHLPKAFNNFSSPQLSSGKIQIRRQSQDSFIESTLSANFGRRKSSKNKIVPSDSESVITPTLHSRNDSYKNIMKPNIATDFENHSKKERKFSLMDRRPESIQNGNQVNFFSNTKQVDSNESQRQTLKNGWPGTCNFKASIIEEEITSNFTGYCEAPNKSSGTQNISQSFQLKTIKPHDPKSVKAIYGRRGFLAFLQTLFGCLNEEEKHLVNFFFTIRNRIIDYCDQVGKKTTEMPLCEQEMLFNHIEIRESDGSTLQFQNDVRESEALSKKHLQMIANKGKLMNQFFKNTIVTYSNNISQPQVMRKMSNLQHLLKEVLGSKQQDQSDQSGGTQLPNNIYQDVCGMSPRHKMSLKQMLKMKSDSESESDDDNIWFEINKGQFDEIVSKDSMKDSSESVSISSQSLTDLEESRRKTKQVKIESSAFDFLTYQEIMMFIKWINVFEDQKYVNQMIFWLLLQFPITNQSTLDFIAEHKQMHFTQGGGDASEMSCQLSEEVKEMEHHQTSIVDYLFPFRVFQLILDNMSRHQILDLYDRFSDGAQKELKQVEYNTQLSTIRQEFIWPLFNLKKDLSREVLYLVIKEKFNETLTLVSDTLIHYTQVDKDLRAFKKGTKINKKIVSQFKAGIKRLNMKNSYFTTIDESIFIESNLQRYVLQQEYKILAPQILDQIIEDKQIDSQIAKANITFGNLNENKQVEVFVGFRSSSQEKPKKVNKSFLNIFKPKEKKSSTKKVKAPKGHKNSIDFQLPDSFKQALQNFETKKSVQPQTPIKEQKRNEFQIQKSMRVSSKTKQRMFSPTKNLTVVKRLKTPIGASIKLLACVIEFWTIKENHNLLCKKDVMDGVSNNNDLKPKRIEFLKSKVLKQIKRFEDVEPVFLPPDEFEVLPYEMTAQEYIEYSKQCFYLNIFNAIVLFKITEISVLKPTKLFGLKNYNSWVALMHNTSIVISNRSYTAFEIKQQIIKNVNRRPASSHCVDHRFVHPLVEYGFFIPIQGNLRLGQLCFTNVSHLTFQLARSVNMKLRTEIKIKKDFNIIMLPSSLKGSIPPEAIKINYDEENSGLSQVYRILNFVFTQVMMFGCMEMDFHNPAKEQTQLFKILQRIKPFIKETLPMNGSFNMRVDASFGKADRLGITQSSIKDDTPEYHVEFIEQDHSLKASKITKGLVQYFKDVLLIQAKKRTVVEEVIFE